MLFRETLVIYRESLGEDHFLTISCLNNLGLLYQDLGRYEEAAGLHAQCLMLLSQGETNEIAYATTLNNLASAKRGQGNIAGVELLLKEALAIYQRVLGAEHSLYAYGLNNLAAYYSTAGDYEQAVQQYQQSLLLCRKLFGCHSRNYTVSLTNLAAMLAKLGRHEEVASLHREAQELQAGKNP